LFLVLHKIHSQGSTQTQIMHKAKGASISVFPLRKFYTEQIFVLVRTQLCNHRHTASVAFQAIEF